MYYNAYQKKPFPIFEKGFFITRKRLFRYAKKAFLNNEIGIFSFLKCVFRIL